MSRFIAVFSISTAVVIGTILYVLSSAATDDWSTVASIFGLVLVFGGAGMIRPVFRRVTFFRAIGAMLGAFTLFGGLAIIQFAAKLL